MDLCPSGRNPKPVPSLPCKQCKNLLAPLDVERKDHDWGFAIKEKGNIKRGGANVPKPTDFRGKEQACWAEAPASHLAWSCSTLHTLLQPRGAVPRTATNQEPPVMGREAGLCWLVIAVDLCPARFKGLLLGEMNFPRRLPSQLLGAGLSLLLLLEGVWSKR